MVFRVAEPARMDEKWVRAVVQGGYITSNKAQENSRPERGGGFGQDVVRQRRGAFIRQLGQVIDRSKANLFH